jgi:PRTRC genetic system protein E
MNNTRELGRLGHEGETVDLDRGLGGQGATFDQRADAHIMTPPEDEIDALPENEEVRLIAEADAEAAAEAEGEADAQNALLENDVAEGDDPSTDLDPASVHPQRQTGIIAGLAATLEIGSATVLAIARTGENDIVVSIQPQAGKGDAATALPIQVSGTPEEIDAQLLDALAHYVPARQFVNRTAAQVAADTTKAAAAAKKAADERRTTSGNGAKTRPALEKLLVTATPQFCRLDVIDGGGKKHVVSNNKRVELPFGTYAITAKADGYVTETTTVKIEKDKPAKIELSLKRKEPSLLDTIAEATL